MYKSKRFRRFTRITVRLSVLLLSTTQIRTATPVLSAAHCNTDCTPSHNDWHLQKTREASFAPGSKKPKLKRFPLVAISLMHSMFSSTFSRSVNGEGNKKSARTL